MTSLRTGALILGALLVLLLLPSAALAAEASITDDGIDPDPVIAEVDEVVSFTNDTEDDVRLVDEDGRWDSGTLAPGEVFMITFDDDGSYAFSSEDGAITGTIEVGDAEAADEPTEEPTDEPTQDPTDEPTAAPAADDAPTAAPTADDAPTAAPTADDAPPVTELAATGLPSAGLAWTAALITLVGLVVLRRTSTR